MATKRARTLPHVQLSVLCSSKSAKLVPRWNVHHHLHMLLFRHMCPVLPLVHFYLCNCGSRNCGFRGIFLLSFSVRGTALKLPSLAFHPVVFCARQTMSVRRHAHTHTIHCLAQKMRGSECAVSHSCSLPILSTSFHVSQSTYVRTYEQVCISSSALPFRLSPRCPHPPPPPTSTFPPPSLPRPNRRVCYLSIMWAAREASLQSVKTNKVIESLSGFLQRLFERNTRMHARMHTHTHTHTRTRPHARAHTLQSTIRCRTSVLPTLINVQRVAAPRVCNDVQ